MLANLVQKSLLVVDDEKDILDIVCSELKSLGAVCFKASGMLEALKILEKEKIDLILSDVRMPIHTGIDLLKAVREITTQVPMILMTGYSDLKLPQAYHLGAELMISKPFDLDELGNFFNIYTVPLPERWETIELSTEVEVQNPEKVVFGRGGVLFLDEAINGTRPKVGESKTVYFKFTEQRLKLVCRWHYGDKWGAEVVAWDAATKEMKWSHLEKVPYIPFNP